MLEGPANFVLANQVREQGCWTAVFQCLCAIMVEWRSTVCLCPILAYSVQMGCYNLIRSVTADLGAVAAAWLRRGSDRSAEDSLTANSVITR